jgi:hypothetical protein
MEFKPNSHPANSIRHAYSRYEYICANILALTYPFRHYKKFATLRLFVETMPIYKAVASGNGKRFFKWKQHVQIANDPQSPQCQTKAELLWPSLPPSFFVTIYL